VAAGAPSSFRQGIGQAFKAARAGARGLRFADSRHRVPGAGPTPPGCAFTPGFGVTSRPSRVGQADQDQKHQYIHSGPPSLGSRRTASPRPAQPRATRARAAPSWVESKARRRRFCSRRPRPAPGIGLQQPAPEPGSAQPYHGTQRAAKKASRADQRGEKKREQNAIKKLRGREDVTPRLTLSG